MAADANLLLLVAAAGFCAAVLGGISGFGGGIVLAALLSALFEPAQLLFVLAFASAAMNANRLLAYRHFVHWRIACRFLFSATPTCLMGAILVGGSDPRFLSALLGGFMLCSTPLRWKLMAADVKLGTSGERLAGSAYGLAAGCVTGAGFALLSALGMLGLRGSALIATDALVSLGLNAVKLVAFKQVGIGAADLWAPVLSVTLATLPGAHVGKWLSERINVRSHSLVIEIASAFGASILFSRAF